MYPFSPRPRMGVGAHISVVVHWGAPLGVLSKAFSSTTS